MSSEWAKNYVAQHLDRNPRSPGYHMPMPELVVRPGRPVAMEVGKPVDEKAAGALTLMELFYEFHMEVERREAT
jgi:hypothetical protein